MNRINTLNISVYPIKINKRLYSFLLFVALVSMSYSQEKKLIRQGNSAYTSGEFEASELKYRKAQELQPKSFEAGFNLGDALFRQKKFEEAAKQFEYLAQQENNKINKAKAYHNLGNSYLQQQKYEESVSAYKNALRNNPDDKETRYNLAYAQKMFKKQQEQQKQDQQNKDEQNKDQQNKDQQNKDQQNKDQQNKDQQNKDQQNKDQQKQGSEQIPKEKADQMLKALENDEKDLQKKMKKQQVKGQKKKIEKDW